MFTQKNYLFFVMLLLFGIIFSYFFLDRNVAMYFIEHSETYTKIGKTISISGESHWYIGAGILGYLFFKYLNKNRLYEQRFLFLFYINIFSGFISVLSKWLFARVRPWGVKNGGDEYGFLLFQNFDMSFIEKMKYQLATLIESPGTYSSFPSGHTTTLFAVATYGALLFPKYKYLWFIIAFISACSRVIANDHYISDVLAGVIVGVGATLFLYSKMKDRLN